MGDVFRNIFGGSKSESQATNEPVDMTPQAFKDLQPTLATYLKQFAAQGGGPSYTGPLTTPIGANEQNVLDQLMQMTGPTTDRSGYINNVIAGKFLPGQSGSNPFLEAAIREAQRPTLEGLTETLSRELPGRFTQAGQFVQPEGSSAFDRAAALASRGAADALAGIATNMSYAGYDAERGRQQEAVGLSQNEVTSTLNNLQAQALPRLIQEVGIDRGLQLFQQRSQELLNVLQIMAGVTKPTIAQKAQSTTESESSAGIGNVFKAFFPGGL